MLFKPNVKINRVTDITPDFLNGLKISALILDIDNTLSTHHGEQLIPGLEDWLYTMKTNNIKLIILSNSKETRVKPFAEKIGLPYIAMGLKPLPFKFFKAFGYLNVKRKNIALVGDQLFTDSLGAHLAGIKSIISDPVLPENIPSFKFKRHLEKILYSVYKF